MNSTVMRREISGKIGQWPPVVTSCKFMLLKIFSFHTSRKWLPYDWSGLGCTLFFCDDSFKVTQTTDL